MLEGEGGGCQFSEGGMSRFLKSLEGAHISPTPPVMFSEWSLRHNIHKMFVLPIIYQS